jgi:hypothetical protein
LNIYRNRTKEEQNQKIISGFPLKDERHFTIKDPYGYNNGDFIGFMDGLYACENKARTVK